LRVVLKVAVTVFRMADWTVGQKDQTMAVEKVVARVAQKVGLRVQQLAVH
jgi:hypothetical protein